MGVRSQSATSGHGRRAIGRCCDASCTRKPGGIHPGPDRRSLHRRGLALGGSPDHAAGYFSRLRPKPWIRVIETATVEPMHVAGWMLVSSGGGARESIGERIIETPENLERSELRDDRSGFVAFVPPGSIGAGRALVESGGGRTMPCASCHGSHLKGLDAVPSLAGRSPSYLVRQLYDLKSGARRGTAVQAMQPVVAKLTLADMVAIAAYAASLPP
jgi:cytochrome c553